MCLLPDKPSSNPTVDQVEAIRTLAETYAVDIRCSSDVGVAELQLWYRQLAALDKLPVLLMHLGCAVVHITMH